MTYCRLCGANNAEDALFCTECGKPMRIASENSGAPAFESVERPVQGLEIPRPVVRNYLVESIIVTMCCCWPLGIPAIVYAAQVNAKVGVGDTAGAQTASNNARRYCILSLVLGILWGVIVLLTEIASQANGGIYY